MDYGNDLLLIAGITNSKNDPGFFNSLDRSTRLDSPVVAYRIAMILLAGSVAESIFINNKISDGMLEFPVDGPDLSRVQNVNYFLKCINTSHNPDYINDCLTDLKKLLAIPDFWSAVEALAKAILENPDKKLDKTQIEMNLRVNGYLNYIKKFNQQ